MTPNPLTQWSDRLAFDIALMREGSGEPLQEILKTHNLSKKDMLVFSKDPVFDKRVQEYQEEIRKNGLTFRLKARAQAEELLTTSYLLIHDPEVSPAVKADLIKSTVKWAGLEPSGKEGPSGAGGGVTIQINLPTLPQPADPSPILINLPGVGDTYELPSLEDRNGEAQTLPVIESVPAAPTG